MREYMLLGEIACILGATLFVHGPGKIVATALTPGQLIGNHFSSPDGVAWSVWSRE